MAHFSCDYIMGYYLQVILAMPGYSFGLLYILVRIYIYIYIYIYTYIYNYIYIYVYIYIYPHLMGYNIKTILMQDIQVMLAIQWLGREP